MLREIVFFSEKVQFSAVDGRVVISRPMEHPGAGFSEAANLFILSSNFLLRDLFPSEICICTGFFLKIIVSIPSIKRGLQIFQVVSPTIIIVFSFFGMAYTCI